MIKLHDRNDVESTKSPTLSMYQIICKYKLRDFRMPIISANYINEAGGKMGGVAIWKGVLEGYPNLIFCAVCLSLFFWA